MTINTPQTSKHRFKRRIFLKYAAATGITVALGDALLTNAPWLDYEQKTRQVWESAFVKSDSPLREIVRYATLAPSSHNAQPWKFALAENTIRLTPDYARRLPILDPYDRELWISLGCALENLVIAANANGYETEIAYPTPTDGAIVVQLKRGAARNTALFAAIPHRQSTRSLYDGRALSVSMRKQLEAVSGGAGVSLRVLDAATAKESILEIIVSGNVSQYENALFTDELISWLRFNKPEALHEMDGLYSICTGNPNVPRWIGQHFVTSGGAARQSESDAANLRSSSGLIVIATAQEDKRHWIESGRLAQRLCLTLTASNFVTAYLNAPIEVPQTRAQLGQLLDLGHLQPQLLLRFGVAPPMPRSLRRSVEDVLV